MAYFAKADIFADPFGSFLRGYRQGQEDDRKDIALLDRLQRTALAARAEDRAMLGLLLDEEYRRDKFEFDKQRYEQSLVDPLQMADEVYDKAAGGAQTQITEQAIEPPEPDTQPAAPAKPQAPAAAPPVELPPPVPPPVDAAPKIEPQRVVPPTAGTTGGAALPVPPPAGGQTLAERAAQRQSDAMYTFETNPLRQYVERMDAPSKRKKYYDRIPQEQPAPKQKIQDRITSLPEGKKVYDRIEPTAQLPASAQAQVTNVNGAQSVVTRPALPSVTDQLNRALTTMQKIDQALANPNLSPANRERLMDLKKRLERLIDQLRRRQ